MELIVKRQPSTLLSTPGDLYIVERKWFSFTLEDIIRDVKVSGQTAIPAGRYRVELTWSPKYGKLMPLIEAVPGFSGIRIHSGNTHKDTEGCLLVGFERDGLDTLKGGTSRPAFQALFEKLVEAESRSDPIYITIENTPTTSDIQPVVAT